MDIRRESNSAWNHIVAGEYRAAIDIYDRLVLLEPNVGDWNNYGAALLSVGDPARAEHAFRRARAMPDPVGIVSRDVGGALWLQGRTSDACADWQAELTRIMTTKLKRHDASGLLLISLLWWASRRLNAPQMWELLQPQLKAVLKTPGQQLPWGLAIIGCVAGYITPVQFLHQASGTDDMNPANLDLGALERTSHAYFYLAGGHGIKSQVWRECLEAAVRYGTPAAITTPEYHIAKYELAST